MKIIWILAVVLLTGCTATFEDTRINSLVAQDQIRLESSGVPGANYQVILPTPLRGNGWNSEDPEDRKYWVEEVIKKMRACGNSAFTFQVIETTKKVDFVGDGWMGPSDYGNYYIQIALECGVS